MGYSAFDISRAIGNKLSEGVRESRDENLIEKIIAETANNPEAMQDAMGKILSKVSPERQPMAINYLKGAYENVQAKQKQARERQAAIDAGLTPDLPAALQVEQYKAKQKENRMRQYGLAPGDQTAPNQMPQNQVMPGQPPVAGETPPTQNQPVSDNPMARFTEGQLVALEGSPDPEVQRMAKAERKRREALEKESREDIRQGSSETLKERQEIAQKAQDAEQAIGEKERMIELIDSGKLDDPTVASILNAIPMKLGQRFLSPQTVEYKSTLINGYRDLRNIFKGQTRIKEIELLEEKLADIYLTDQQKKSILKSSMKTLQYDIIRAEAAAEVEEKYPGLKALAFSKKVREIMNPKLEALANRVIDEQKSIFQDAENKKKIKLDLRDSEDVEIIDQIILEAKKEGISPKAYAKKKGYTL